MSEVLSSIIQAWGEGGDSALRSLLLVGTNFSGFLVNQKKIIKF